MSVLKTPEEKFEFNKEFNKLVHTQRSYKKLSSKHLTNEQLDLLKFGLHHSLPALRIYKTNLFVSFEMMHCFLLENLKLHLANSYIHYYKPSRSTLRKNEILK